MGWEIGAPGERPRHRVAVSAFSIARTPVTNAEYAAYLAATGAAPPAFWTDVRFSDPRQPVVGVSWFDAEAFCRWLGPGFRLPTEAEWEKAARGDLDDRRFPWGDDRPENATRPDRPPRVGTTPANTLGLTDLSGVCHEWCLDWHDDGTYRTARERDPLGPATGTRRVSRGGAWRHADPWSPVAHRSSLPPHLRYSDYGFRVVDASRSGPPSAG
jgi:formylglycine-generating enzyme required for sulfatase activity